MKQLANVLFFGACAAGAAEHQALHISPAFEVVFILGAAIAFFKVIDE